MNKVLKFWKVVILDTLGVALMIAALLTGWLPGPGGIPLFILGLSLLAINHDWAQRYIDNLQDYVKKLSDQIFNQNPTVQMTYDVISPLMVIGGALLLWSHSAAWKVSLGIFLLFSGITILLGNRHRWQQLKKHFKK